MNRTKPKLSQAQLIEELRSLRAEIDRLKRSETLLKRLFDTSLHSMFVKDRSGRYILVNAAMAGLYGKKPEEMIGRTDPDLAGESRLSGGEAEKLFEDDRRVIIQREIQNIPEAAMTLADGTTRWFRTVKTPLDLCPGTTYVLGIAVDISERKHLEEEVRSSEHKFRTLVQTATDAIVLTDLDGNVVLWNRGAEEIFGFSGAEILGRKLLPIIPERFHEVFLRELKGVYERQADDFLKRTVELRAVRKGGEEIDVELSMAAWTAGHDPFVTYIIRDITERKRLETALRESELRYRMLFEKLSSGVVVIEAAGDGEDFFIRDVNKKAARVTGVKKKEIIGKSIGRVFPGLIEAGRPDIYRQVWKTGKGRHEAPWLYRDSRLSLWIESRIYRLTAEQLVILFDDVTEEVLARDELEKNEEWLRSIFEGSRDAIFIARSDSQLVDVNTAAVDLTGYSKQELTAMSIPDLCDGVDRDAYRQYFSRIMAGEPIVNEARIRCKDGSKVYAELSNKRIVINGIPYMHITARDSSGRKKMEEMLRESHEELRDLYINLESVREEERSRISREIHDELGQDLTALRMDISILEKKLVGVEQREVFEQLESMKALLVSTSESVRKITSQLRPGLLDDLGLIAAMEWQTAEFDRRTGIRCRLETDPAEIELSDELATAFFRILQEALTNVSRHAQASEVHVRFQHDDGWLKLEIADNGAGLSGNQVRKKGCFGLIGIRERVRNMKGEFHIEGKPNEGTTLSVSIPDNEGGEET